MNHCEVVSISCIDCANSAKRGGANACAYAPIIPFIAHGNGMYVSAHIVFRSSNQGSSRYTLVAASSEHVHATLLIDQNFAVI
jgi:hypothetical protein